LKIRHGAIVENIVFNVYEKFNDDRLWNEKALVHWKSDNNNPKKKNKKNNVHSVSGSKKINSLQPTSAQKKVIVIGSAETRTSILQPTRGMIRYAIRISNVEPNAHIVYIQA